MEEFESILREYHGNRPFCRLSKKHNGKIVTRARHVVLPRGDTDTSYVWCGYKENVYTLQVSEDEKRFSLFPLPGYDVLTIVLESGKNDALLDDGWVIYEPHEKAPGDDDRVFAAFSLHLKKSTGRDLKQTMSVIEHNKEIVFRLTQGRALEP